MFDMWGWLTVAAVAALAGVAWWMVRRRRTAGSRRLCWDDVSRAFHAQRERLEAKFLELASQSGRPRGLRWVDCEFDDDVTYAQDRRTGELTALVGVAVSFEAIVGGGMEDVEAVSNIRAATAVFTYDGENWATAGRTVFNLNPSQTIGHFRQQLELVGHEPSAAPRGRSESL